MSYKYVRAVDELFQPLLGDQQHLIEQEESSLLLHSMDLEGTLKNQLPKPAKVRPGPVHQQGLDFLWSDERTAVVEDLLQSTAELEAPSFVNEKHLAAQVT